MAGITTMRGRGALLLAVAGVLVLGACNGGDKPSPSTTSTSTSSPSSSPSSPPTTTPPSTTPPSTASSYPPAARAKTPAGAVAFVRFFMGEMNHAWTGPKAGLIASLSDPGCQFCHKSEADAAKYVSRKQRYNRDPVRVTDVKAIVGAPKGQQYLRMIADQVGASIVNASGTVVDTDKRVTADKSNVSVVWKGGRWLMFEVEAP